VIYESSWQGCADTRTPINLATLMPQILAPINDCAALAIGNGGGVWVASPIGVAQLPDAPAVNTTTRLVAVPDGVWVAGQDSDGAPVVAFVQPGKVTPVVLPAGTARVDAAAQVGDHILVGVGTSSSVSLLSVSVDGTATTLWSIPDEATVASIAADGTQIAFAVTDATGVTVVRGDGQEWTQDDLGVGYGASLGIGGDMLVVVFNQEDAHGIPTNFVTAVSRDSGATWARTPTLGGYAGEIVGFDAGAAVALMSVPDTSTGIFTLAESGTWAPYTPITTVPPEAGVAVALTTCGAWTLDYGASTLAYVPLPGRC